VCGEDEGEAGGGKGTYGAGRCADSYVRSVCFSPDSKYLVAGAEDKTIKLWDIKGKRLRHSLHGHSKDIYSVDYSADGQYVVSGSGDKRAKLWDVNTGTCVRTFGDEDGPRDGVTSVAVSRDSRYIAAGSLDRVVRCPALFRAVPPRARGATDIGEGGAPHAARHTHTHTQTHTHTGCGSSRPGSCWRSLTGTTTRSTRCRSRRTLSFWRRGRWTRRSSSGT
jgi:hypothetical protein